MSDDIEIDLIEQLRTMGCDREPFTPEHAACKCRLANEAADEIEYLRRTQEDYKNVLRAALLEPNGVDLVNRLTGAALRARDNPT